MEINKTEPRTEGRLPWHKPEVQRLVVSLDTQSGMQQVAKVGSGNDVDFMTTIGG
jgi:hypothetical protein